MNRYDRQLRAGKIASLVSFILVMIFGFFANEELMGLQISLALIFLSSFGYAMIGLLYRDDK